MFIVISQEFEYKNFMFAEIVNNFLGVHRVVLVIFNKVYT